VKFNVKTISAEFWHL